MVLGELTRKMANRLSAISFFGDRLFVRGFVEIRNKSSK